MLATGYEAEQLSLSQIAATTFIVIHFNIILLSGVQFFEVIAFRRFSTKVILFVESEYIFSPISPLL
jgi:hypothetical protein